MAGGDSLGSEDPRSYEALGRAIKVLRAQRGLGRRELADLAGISYPYLSEIENGKKRPSSRALLSIAEALGVPPSVVLESAESLHATSPRPFAIDPDTVGVVPEPRTSSPDLPKDVGQWFHRLGSVAWSSAPAPASPMAAPPPEPDRTMVDRERQDLIRRLIEMAQRLSPRDLERLLDLARRLAE